MDDLSEIDRVFQIFVKLRGLSPIYTITCDPDRTSWLLVYKDKKLENSYYTEEEFEDLEESSKEFLNSAKKEIHLLLY